MFLKTLKKKKPMYDMPFVLQLSEKYKLCRPDFLDDKSIVNREYNLEDFFHSFSDLSQIKFKESDSTKSIFDNSFVEKKRLIKDGEDYEKMLFSLLIQLIQQKRDDI